MKWILIVAVLVFLINFLEVYYSFSLFKSLISYVSIPTLYAVSTTYRFNQAFSQAFVSAIYTIILSVAYLKILFTTAPSQRVKTAFLAAKVTILAISFYSVLYGIITPGDEFGLNLFFAFIVTPFISSPLAGLLVFLIVLPFSLYFYDRHELS
jgi:hypothetical protein